jgi:hypothetical protein
LFDGAIQLAAKGIRYERALVRGCERQNLSSVRSGPRGRVLANETGETVVGGQDLGEVPQLDASKTSLDKSAACPWLEFVDTATGRRERLSHAAAVVAFLQDALPFCGPSLLGSGSAVEKARILDIISLAHSCLLMPTSDALRGERESSAAGAESTDGHGSDSRCSMIAQVGLRTVWICMRAQCAHRHRSMRGRGCVLCLQGYRCIA